MVAGTDGFKATATPYSDYSALAAILFGGLAIVGHVANLLFRVRIWNYAGLALHTSMGFLLVGCALLGVVRSEGGLRWSLDRLTTPGFVIGIVSVLAAAAGSYDFTSQLQQAATQVGAF